MMFFILLLTATGMFGLYAQEGYFPFEREGKMKRAERRHLIEIMEHAKNSHLYLMYYLLMEQQESKCPLGSLYRLHLQEQRDAILARLMASHNSLAGSFEYFVKEIRLGLAENQACQPQHQYAEQIDAVERTVAAKMEGNKTPEPFNKQAFETKYAHQLKAVEELEDEFASLKDRVTWDSSPETVGRFVELKQRIRCILSTIPTKELWRWANSEEEDQNE